MMDDWGGGGDSSGADGWWRCKLQVVMFDKSTERLGVARFYTPFLTSAGVFRGKSVSAAHSVYDSLCR